LFIASSNRFSLTQELMAIELIWEARGAYRKFAGSVTAADLAKTREKFCGDARFDTARYLINDFLEAIPASDITHEVAEFSAAHDFAAAISNPRILIACVTTDKTVHSLIQTYISSGFGYPVEIFSTLAEARAWTERLSASFREPGVNRLTVGGRVSAPEIEEWVPGIHTHSHKNYTGNRLHLPAGAPTLDPEV